MEARKWSWRFKFGEISEHYSQIFRRTWRISGPEVADGAKPDVPTTDRQNEKKKKRRPFYEAVDAHARRRLKNKPSILWSGRRACASPLKKKRRPFYEAAPLKKTPSILWSGRRACASPLNKTLRKIEHLRSPQTKNPLEKLPTPNMIR